jgi:hypothetical protein
MQPAALQPSEENGLSILVTKELELASRDLVAHNVSSQSGDYCV